MTTNERLSLYYHARPPDFGICRVVVLVSIHPHSYGTVPVFVVPLLA